MTFKALFSPDQHEFFINVKVVRSEYQLEKEQLAIDAMVNGEIANKWISGTEAFTVYNHNSQTFDMGTIFFLSTSRRIICHECVHAALSFIDHKVMGSEQVLAMPDDEKHDYFHEALATITDNLFAQIEEEIYR